MKEPRDLWQGKGHGIRGRTVRGFFKFTIIKKESILFFKNAKPREINIKVLGLSKCPFKALGEVHGTLTLEEDLGLFQEGASMSRKSMDELSDMSSQESKIRRSKERINYQRFK